MKESMIGGGMPDSEKSEGKSESDKTDQSRKESGGTEAGALPGPTSDKAYVTMLTADAGGYEVFRATELLGTQGRAAMSENQKIQILEANGFMQNAIDLDAMKLTGEENKTGLALVGMASAAMLLLLGLLYYKRRKMNRMA